MNFNDTKNAATVRAIITRQLVRSELIGDGEAAKIRERIDTVVENIYQRLPSGDYGRGDVRRTIVAVVDAWDTEDHVSDD